MAHLFDPFLNFDLSVFQWIQSIQNDFLDALLVGITTLGNGGIVFIIIGLALLFTKKYRKAGLAVITALLVMLICNDLVLKELFARPRPFNLLDTDPEKYAFWAKEYIYPNLIEKPTSLSFPSGHTSSAFAAAFACIFCSRKWGIPTLILAFFMGFSRIYVEVHYCTDVLAGVISGAVCALIALVIVKYLFPVIDKGLDKLSLKLKKQK